MQQHPVDRLADIRIAQRALRREADAILAQLEAGLIAPIGRSYAALRRSRVLLRPLLAQTAVAPPEDQDFEEWLQKF